MALPLNVDEVLPQALRSTPIKQVAFVVRDLSLAVRAYSALLGVEPWTAYQYAPSDFSEMVYRGRPAAFGLRHALAWKEGIQFELVEPLAGDSIFADHLAEYGEGFHHIGAYVPDHPKAVADVLAARFAPLQSARGFGAAGDGAFAYFSSERLPGLTVELISAPSVRRAPLFVYPEPSESP